MADTAYTHSGDTFAISTTTEDEDLDDHATLGFPGLTYTTINGVVSLGPTGTNTNVVSQPTWGSTVISKGKGLTDAGDAELQLLRIPSDAGQIAIAAAGAPSVRANYAFKHVKQNGETRYYRGLVMGPVHQGGENEAVDTDTYTIALNQLPLTVAAP